MIRFKFIFGVLFLTLFINNIIFCGDEELTNIVIDGVSYSFYTDSVKYYDDANLLSGKLAKKVNLKIDNADVNLLPGNNTVFYKSGKFKSGTLDKSAKIQNFEILPKSEFWLYESGKLSSFYSLKDIKNGKIVFRAGKYDMKEEQFKYQTALYESGNISSSYLKKDTIFNLNNQKVKFSGSQDCDISFYDNGSVKFGYLKEQTTLNNSITFAKDGGIYLYENGFVSKGTLAKESDITVGSDIIKIKGNPSFHDNGSLKMGRISGSATITVNNIKYEINDDSELIFDKQGNLFASKINKDIEVIFNGNKETINGMRDIYYNYSDFDKKVISLVGELSIESLDITASDRLNFLSDNNYNQLTFINYYPNDNCKSFLKIDENSFSYKNDTYVCKPFTLYEFDESGNLKKD